MPPKTKSKGKGNKQKKSNEPKEKKDKPAKTDGDPMEKSDAVPEKTKDELWEECVELQEKLKRVQKEKKLFKTELGTARTLWDNSKRRLEETKVRMREKLQLKRDAEKHNRAESEKHKLKLKQLRTAHHNEICEQKMAAITTSSNIQEDNVESEIELQKNMYHVQADKGLKQSSAKIYIRHLQQKQQEELRKLVKSYENQVQVIEDKHRSRMKSMVKVSRIETQREFEDINKRMTERIASSLAANDEDWGFIDAFVEFKVPGCPAYEKAVAEKTFKDLKIKQKKLNSKMEAAAERKKGLTDSLLEVEEMLSKNHNEKIIQRKEMAMSWKRNQKTTACILRERRDLYLQHNQLELSHVQLHQEYKRLQEKQTKATLSIQQKSNMKALLLENKINAMTEILEKRQLELWLALAFRQLDRSFDKNIKELFESKDATIKALKNDVSHDLEEYDDLVRKAEDLGICANKLLQCCYSPVDHMSTDDLMKELISLSISEHESDQKDAGILSLAAAEFRH